MIQMEEVLCMKIYTGITTDNLEKEIEDEWK